MRCAAQLLSWIIPWWILCSASLMNPHGPGCAVSASAHPSLASLTSSSSSSLAAGEDAGVGPAAVLEGTWGDGDLQILTYHIQSVVISRYAVTTVTCRLRNPALEAQEAAFSILLPTNAFISNLTIEAGGKNYTSLVREKEEAHRTYERAKSGGHNTAIVHQKERETSRFRVDVSVAEQDEVIFYLTYEELLERRLGVYTHKINVHPGYPVQDLLVDLTIHETRDITTLKVKKVPGGEEFRSAVTNWKEGTKTARLQFDPEPGMVPVSAVIHGQLMVQYDVVRALDAGDVQTEHGYFVHFFAPIELQYTPKHITFLIDVSGSMEGTKLSQVKEALRHILTRLNPGDTFNIMSFSTRAHKLGTLRYTGTAVRKAKKFINNLEANGGTNIDGGLKVAIEQDIDDIVSESVRPHIIVLLTDGQPTQGVTSHTGILRNIRARNKDRATIFCLGFGRGADMILLEKIALQNHGTARKIYEDVDAADQLKGFYQELSTPILLDVQFSYSVDAVITESLSTTYFQTYFEGTELVVAGKTEDNLDGGIRANITGQGRNGDFFMGVTDWNTVLPPDHHLLDHLHLAPMPKNFIKRLWAFMRVKNLLAESKAAQGQHEKASAEKKALIIALENHFVTPLTSLVVVQPNQENCKDYEDDEETEEAEQEQDAQQDGSRITPTQKDEPNASHTPHSSYDSVPHGFNPASIQVQDDIDSLDYEYEQKLSGSFSNVQNLANYNSMSSVCSNNPGSIVLLLTACIFLHLLCNQYLQQLRESHGHTSRVK